MSNKCNITFVLNVVDAFCVIFGSNVSHLLWRSHFDHFFRPPLKTAVDGVELRNILDRPDSYVLVLVQVLPLQVGEGGGGGHAGGGVGEGGRRTGSSPGVPSHVCASLHDYMHVAGLARACQRGT